jgi:DNA-binding transcriptional MerR regulator
MFGSARDEPDPVAEVSGARHSQHDRRGVDPDHRRPLCRGPAGGDAWSASDVDHTVRRVEIGELPGGRSHVVPAERHAQRGDGAHRAGEAGVMGMMVRYRVVRDRTVGGRVVGCVIRSPGVVHLTTLTVEVDFKSSAAVDDLIPTELIPIGEVARRAGVATSAIRYYERLGLLDPPERRGGRRCYPQAALRQLVFIGMLQDAGLQLEEIGAILAAATNAEWKQIATARLEALDEELERLQRARDYLAGALLCRYDHPATDCQVMGSEIDRRLALTA